MNLIRKIIIFVLIGVANQCAAAEKSFYLTLSEITNNTNQNLVISNVPTGTLILLASGQTKKDIPVTLSNSPLKPNFGFVEDFDVTNSDSGKQLGRISVYFNGFKAPIFIAFKPAYRAEKDIEAMEKEVRWPSTNRLNIYIELNSKIHANIEAGTAYE